MNAKKNIIKLSIALFLFFGCQNEQKNSKLDLPVASVKNNRSRNLNISILLDLSDRIDTNKYANPALEFYKRDLGYIESISKAFEKHLRGKPIREDNDQIQIYFEPEPLSSQINNLAKKSRLIFTKDNTKKEEILKVSSQYISTSKEIYNLAIKDKKFIGSDIWGFFKNKVNDYCIKPNHRNILFILTDGYMFHKDSKFSEGNKTSYLTPELVTSFNLKTSDYIKKIQENGYGFVLANENLKDLEVFVLGINPAKGNPFEGDVINKYWADWFKGMMIKNSTIKQADLPSNLDPIIQKYINP